ncbi:helix-turn-helix domain-containing protein [Leucobacter sp. CSA1]|uniref:Helix-turn-helix domain-containing protein n=1 Tax=Leucobacter chromiisoli TaxID=2796471 RepID=A0A934Q6K2_9MICO|nr:helix-turn-helix transcriptional regulator [Leucobacter chromiisoli]MBK0418315.1 helix-turn-helix domain-containing protein [Leucobacter chromiisoli]
MDNRAEVREFLTTRRERVTPERVGLPEGSNRRVKGLRRSEVAALAGVSVEYYTRIERGAIGGASPEVLDAIARALLLDHAEQAYLLDLAHAAGPVGRAVRTRRPRPSSLHRTLQWTLDSVTGSAAIVRNGRMDMLAANSVGRAFYRDAYDMPGTTPNFARFIFLDQRGVDFHLDWERAADTAVQILRAEGARNPYDKEHHELIGELSCRSVEFRRRWAAHNVTRHGTGVKYFRHPVVGDLTVAFESLELASEPGLTLTLYTPEPGSPSEERMRLLASWAASEDAGAGRHDSEAEATNA